MFDLTSVLLVLLASVVGYVIGQIRPLKTATSEKLTEIVSDDWRWVLEDAASMAVRAAEQVVVENGDKLKWATNYVVKFLAQNHIKVDEALVRGAIENALLEFQKEIAQEVKAG